MSFSTPAHAGFKERDASYYARQMKSCQSKDRSQWYHIIGALSPTITDACCAQSVAAMQKTGGRRIAANAACPPGERKSTLKCATSKHWCEKK